VPIAIVGLLATGYGVLAIVTADAPPPPAFDRDPAAGFSPDLDGLWYAESCRPFRVLGGWLLPQPAVVLAEVEGRNVTVDQPVDLTGLERGGRPVSARLGEGRFSARWQPGSLTLDGDVQIRLQRQPPPDC
jgi:hypothetical protein